ncbi:MAG: hypothetical protein M5U34_31020 [Chloroflexi bacterium]|nr:hypothetical protein [Chloroflexota bacterium]
MAVRVDQHLNGQVKELDDLVTVMRVRGNEIRYRTPNPERDNPLLVRRLGKWAWVSLPCKR